MSFWSSQGGKPLATYKVEWIHWANRENAAPSKPGGQDTRQILTWSQETNQPLTKPILLGHPLSRFHVAVGQTNGIPFWLVGEFTGGTIWLLTHGHVTLSPGCSVLAFVSPQSFAKRQVQARDAHGDMLQWPLSFTR